MSRIPADVELSLKTLRFAVFDFDGVFTTNDVFVREDGVELVSCNRSDGYGIRLLREVDLGLLILSTETNPVVQARAKKLSIDCISGIESKGERLSSFLKERQLDPQLVAYLGNDVNDLPCFAQVGLAIAVADAFPEVRQAADWVLTHSGGRGAIREFCEAVYRAKHQVPSGQSVWLYREQLRLGSEPGS